MASPSATTIKPKLRGLNLALASSSCWGRGIAIQPWLNPLSALALLGDQKSPGPKANRARIAKVIQRCQRFIT